MTDTDRKRIADLVDELAALVSPEGAFFNLGIHAPPGPMEDTIANERGYLRLAIESLRAGLFPPPSPDQAHLPLDLEYLNPIGKLTDSIELHHADHLRPHPPTDNAREMSQAVGCLILIGMAVLFLCLAILGVILPVQGIVTAYEYYLRNSH